MQFCKISDKQQSNYYIAKQSQNILCEAMKIAALAFGQCFAQR
jgi:hypothetical protein